MTAPEAVACWRAIAQQLPEPSAMLVISAHWEARQPTVSLAGAPETIHDFSGFSPHATVPVTQLSLICNGTPAQHFALGQVLAPLREEGVLVVATVQSRTISIGWMQTLTRVQWHKRGLLQNGLQRDWRCANARVIRLSVGATRCQSAPKRRAFFAAIWRGGRGRR